MDLLEACCVSQPLLGAVLSSIEHVIIVMDSEGSILVANPVVERVFGFTPDELKGKDLSILFTPEDLPKLYPNLLYMAQQKRSFEGELTLVRRDDTRFFAHISFRPYVDAGQNKLVTVASIQDIDKQKRPEEALRDTHYEDLVKIADGIAHEVRNPLVAIGGGVKRIYKSCAGMQDHGKYYEQILNNVRRLEGLVQKVEFFAHLPMPHLRKESIRQLMQESLQPYFQQMKERKIELTNRIEDTSLRVDKSLVVRAFSILVENALDALPEGGLMLIRSETDENQCKIYIADQGVGISSGDLPYIFNPFYRTKPTGVGIDLAVVKQIMNRHGGRVEVESKPGEGTTFLLVFPLERRRPIRMSRLENYEDGFNRVKGTASEVIK